MKIASNKRRVQPMRFVVLLEFSPTTKTAAMSATVITDFTADDRPPETIYME